MTDTPPTISIRVEADFDLAIGDAPEPITAADVVALIERERNVSGFLTQWNLTSDLDVTATVSRPNPHHGQPPMFGEDTSAVAWLHESARAFALREHAPASRPVVDAEAL